MVKNLPAMQCGRRGFDPWLGKMPWRREQQPSPVFLPGEFHSQRMVAKESIVTEWPTLHEALADNCL